MKARFSIGAADRSGESWTEEAPYRHLWIAQVRAEGIRATHPDWTVFVADEEEPERGDLSSTDAEEYHERWGIK